MYPLPKTLQKYGLTKQDYKKLYEEIGGVCPVCEKIPKGGRFRIDHEHVQGWSRMPPEKRKTFVRGLLCMFCNRYYLAKGMNPKKARNIIKFLDNYALRKK
jgi:hypothetical protein